MSKTIDEKVVVMKFDNKDFEKNTKQSMSTLEQLKKKLNLDGATKGLDEIDKASKKVSFSNMENSLLSLQKRFSTTGIIGQTIIQNLTNSVLDFGKKIASVSIDSIVGGGKRRATNLENARFQLKGLLKDLDKVEAVMQNVTDAVDGTAYSLDAAANVASQLAASGMEAGDSMFTALRGVAGVAAMTNSTYEDIGRIYTQVAGQGRLMGDQLLQLSGRGMNAAATLANYLGTTESKVRDMVSAGKIDFQTFADAMDDAFGEHAKEANNTVNGAMENIKSALARIGAEFVAPLIVEKGPLVQFLNLVRERINSIKSAIVPVAKEVTDDINKAITFFVGVLKKVDLGGYTPFKKMKGAINDIVASVDKMVQPIEKVTDGVGAAVKTLEDYTNVVDEIIGGKWGNGQERFNALAEAGYNWAHAQNMVNEKLGFAKRYTDDYVESAEAEGEVTAEVTEKKAKLIEELTTMSAAQLKQKGFTDEQIQALALLGDVAEDTGIPMERLLELIQNDQFNTRFLFFDSIKNVGYTILNILKAIGQAIVEAFSFGAKDLFSFVAGMHEFTQSLRNATENEKGMRNLVDTLKGFFSIIKLIAFIGGGTFKIVWIIIKTVLDTLGYSILDVTAALGRFTSGMVDFITKNQFVSDIIYVLVKALSEAIINTYNFITGFSYLSGVFDHVGNKFDTFKNKFHEWVEGMKKSDNIGKYIFEGLLNGLTKGAVGVYNFLKEMTGKLIDVVKEKLGIHSPSLVFMAIGGFIISGLLLGIKKGSIDVNDTLVQFASSIVDTFLNLIKSISGMAGRIDLGSVLAIASLAGIIYGYLKIAKAIEIFSRNLLSLRDVLDSFSDVLNAFKGVLNSMKYKIMAAAMKDIAIAIAILVGSIYLITTIDTGKLIGAIIAIGTLMAMLSAVTILATKFGGNALDFGKVAVTIVALGVAMMLMASALNKLSKIKDVNDKVIWSFAGMVVALLAALKLIGGNGSSLVKMGGAILAIGVMFKLMASTVKQLGNLDKKVLDQGITALAKFEAMIIALMAATRLISGSTNVGKIGGAILGISVAIFLMSKVVKSLGSMDQGQLKQGIITIGLFEAMIVGLMAATRLLTGSTNVGKIGGAILGIGAAILLMGLTCKLLGGMDTKALTQGIVAVGIFTSFIAALMYMTKYVGSGNLAQVGVMMVGIGVAIGVMALSAVLLGVIDLGNLAKGVTAVGILSLFVAGLLKASEKAQNVGGTVWGLVGAIVAIAGSIALLSLIEPEKLKGPVAAMAILMGMFSLMVKACENMGKGASIKDLAKNIGAMIVIMGLLTGLVFILSTINAENALSSTSAMALLMLAVGGLMLIISNIKVNWQGMLMAAASMAVLIASLYAVIGALALMSGIQNAAQNATVLALFMGAMTLCLIGVAAAGAIYAATGGVALLGLVGILAIVGSLYAVLGVLALMNNIDNASTNLNMMTSFLTLMCGMLLELAIVGPLALTGIAALTGLMMLMPLMIAFSSAVGALVTYIPMLQEFMDKGMSVLIKLAGGLGEMVGAFVGGALSQIASNMPSIGKDLSEFMVNLIPFLTGLNMVNGNTLKNVGILSACIIALTVAELIAGIGKFLTLGGSFSDLGLELSKFMVNAMPFIMGASMITAETGTAIKNLASAILLLTAADLLDGLNNFFNNGEESSLSKFGEEIAPLGGYLATFAAGLQNLDEGSLEKVSLACKAIKNLAEAAKALPKEGGWAQKIFGSGSLKDFADSMPTVASGINGFIANLGDFSADKQPVVDAACKVITTLAEASKKLDKEGGFWQKIFGENGLGKFANQMPEVAKGINGFVNKLKLDEGAEKKVTTAVKIINAFTKISDKKIDGSKISAFGNNMNSIGGKLTQFVETITKYKKNKYSTAAECTKILVDAANSMMNTIGSAITKKKTDVVQAAEAVGKAAANGFSSNAVKNEMSNKGKDFVQGFANGITKHSGIAANAAAAMVRKALTTAANTQKSSSPSKETLKLGNFFGMGYVKGINQYGNKVRIAGENMVDQAMGSLSSAISDISHLIGSDLDANPTITPVLDLSEVSRDAKLIDSMLGTTDVKLLSSLGTVSSNINQRNQNGRNYDVVSALNKLGKTMVPGQSNVYNINGITYGDDSAVAEAVELLVRAANIERRT